MMPETVRIPLLRDRHTHPMLYAALHDGLDLNDGEHDTREEPAELARRAVRRIREYAAGGAAGWTIVQGWNSGRFPLTQEDFDDLPPLVIFNLSLHGLIVNEAGRTLLGRSDPDVAAHLDSQEWVERNLRRVLNVFANEGASPERLVRFFDWLLEEHGIHDVDEMLLVDENEIRLFDEAGLAGRVRFWAAPDQYERLSPDARNRIHGVKLFTDGAIGAWTAALHRPYRGFPGDVFPDQTGLLLYRREELEGILRTYLGAGTPVAVHAIGDRAIDQVVDAVESVAPPSGREIRIEHAQFISEPVARRAKALGMHLCMQPNFSDDSVHYAQRLPDDYPDRNNPLRMLIDRVGYVPGEDLCFGSDGMPHGFREALRQSLFPAVSGQALTVAEFVAGYCLRGGDAERLGHIEVRIDADAKTVAGRVTR